MINWKAILYTSTTIARYCICVIDESRTFSIDQPTSHSTPINTHPSRYNHTKIVLIALWMECQKIFSTELTRWVLPLCLPSSFAALHKVSPQHWINVVHKLIWDLLKCCILYMRVCSFGRCKNNYALSSFYYIYFSNVVCVCVFVCLYKK